MKVETAEKILALSKVVRLILTGALIYGVYTETGIFTASVLGLTTIAFELNAYQKKKERGVRVVNDALASVIVSSSKPKIDKQKIIL